MRCHAILVAAGGGERFGAQKQFLPLAGQTVLWHAARRFLECERVLSVRVITARDSVVVAQEALGGLAADARVQILPVGGKTRAESVENGLAGVPPDEWAAVHDAARPCLSAAALQRVLDCAQGSGTGAALGLPVSDALKKCEEGRLLGSAPREGVWAMQTPQVFLAGELARALAAARKAGASVADEAEAILLAGGVARAALGEARNIKITYAEDLALAQRILA